MTEAKKPIELPSLIRRAMREVDWNKSDVEHMLFNLVKGTIRSGIYSHVAELRANQKPEGETIEDKFALAIGTTYLVVLEKQIEMYARIIAHMMVTDIKSELNL